MRMEPLTRLILKFSAKNKEHHNFEKIALKKLEGEYGYIFQQSMITFLCIPPPPQPTHNKSLYEKIS